ncbi:MAG: hypothetical protein U5K37_03955 [Natrialbaceae archaeon]|nr:hypothetical protein [Natrialbaceae archaeon]
MEDHGVNGGNHRVSEDDDLTVEAIVKNPTDKNFTDCDVKLEVLGTGITPVDASGAASCSNIAPGSKGPHDFEVPSATLSSNLAFGSVYDYTVYPIDVVGNPVPDQGLDSPGSFYYGKNGVYLNVSDARVDGQPAGSPVEVENETINVSANIHNIGVQNATNEPIQFDLESNDTTGIDWYAIDTQHVNRTYGQDGRVTWSLNTSHLLRGEHKFTISSNDDQVTGYFTLEHGVDANDTEIFLETNTKVDVTVLGSELGSSGPNPTWSPVLVDVFTQPVDEDGNPEGTADEIATSFNDENVGVVSGGRRVAGFQDEFTVDERVSLMIRGTSYSDCSSYQAVGYDGATHYECPTGNEYNERISEDANTSTQQYQTRVISKNQSQLPGIDPVYDVQMSPTEMLDDVGIETTQINEDVADVHLDENEFLFVFELSEEPNEVCI